MERDPDDRSLCRDRKSTACVKKLSSRGRPAFRARSAAPSSSRMRSQVSGVDKPSARAVWAEVDASGTAVASIAFGTRKRRSGESFGQRRASAILDTRRRLLGTRIVLPRSIKTGNSPLRLLTAGRARSFLSAFTLREMPLIDTLEQKRFLVLVE